jgi:hypothetical protein
VGELSLAIAGLRIAVVTRDPDVDDLIHDRYKGFVSPGVADWRLELDIAALACRSPADDVLVARHDGAPRLRVERADFRATVDLRDRTATVTLADTNEYSLDSFLRVLYSLALVDAGGLIVHAASLTRHGVARLFCGRSGSGKTTLAGLSPEATLLSDELSIVRTAGARPHCHGTPFWGKFARAGTDQSAPLAAIYFLHHGRRHVVERVSRRQALERLLPNVLFFARDAELTGRVLAIASDLVEAVPCYDLFFRLDSGFWEVIDHA